MNCPPSLRPDGPLRKPSARAHAFRLFATFCLLLVASSLRAATWVVHPDGSGDAPTIQAAVAVAAIGDTLLLGPGTFTGAGNRGVNLVGKDLTVNSTAGPAATIIDCTGADRAFLIFPGETTAFSGITIRNGDSGALPGGAVQALSSVTTFTDCTFEDNSAGGDLFSNGGGGALFGSGGTLVVTGCRFLRNSATWPDGIGGGISVVSGSAFVTESDFDDNRTGLGQFSGGAGILTWQAQTVVVDGCTFVRNVSTAAGGLFVFAANGAVSGCHFSGNTASSSAAMATVTPVTISDCTFVGNRGSSGTGALSMNGPASLTGCEFTGNTAATFGGGAYVASQVSFVECTFAGNAAADGGAVCVTGAADLDRCTFFGNSAARGAHVFARVSGDASLTHCILAFGAGAAAECEPGTTVSATCCDVFGNSNGNFTGCLSGQGGTNGNFSADPFFCDAGNGDFTLRSDSPCAPPGATGCGQVGAFAVACGPISIESMGWARVKALYRE